MSRGDNDDQIEYDGNPLWYWYDKQKSGESENTNKSRRQRIKRFERWLAAQGTYEHNCHWADIDLDEVDHADMVPAAEVTPSIAEEFLRDLKENFAPDTQQNAASVLSRAYDYCESKVKKVDIDPFAEVQEVENKDILDEPKPRNAYIISKTELREYVRAMHNPLWVTVVLLLCKLPRRIGGVSNLDLEDLNIDHPACDWEVHPAVRHWDDHIVFRPSKQQSDTGRNTGNKTGTTAVYPLDDELKDALLWYLAVRPGDKTPTSPLFRTMQRHKRMSGSLAHKAITSHSKAVTENEEIDVTAWYGAGDGDNINPHYFRHLGTTHYQDTLGNESLVDYLRGDKGQGSKADYNQYTAKKKRKILSEMPKIFEPYIDDD